MELLSTANALSVSAVVIITELLKLVPVSFTSKYPAWVNGIVSVIAAIIVVSPSLNLNDIAQTAGTAILIAVVAAIAYNQFVSKLKTNGTVQK